MKLHLNLKGEYFDKIQWGAKLHEYRLYNEYWKKRLENREYDGVLVKRGYPKRGDKSKILERPWLGYEVMTITHKHFGKDPVKVFAIRVN